MAKRSNLSSTSEWLETGVYVEEEIVPQEVLVYNTVRLVLMKDLKLKLKGPVTEAEYFWNGPGSEVDVNEEDAEIILKKQSFRACCSGSQTTPYFEIVR